jgi:hypothetical protein
MLATRSRTLVGERCPAAALAECYGNRNICGLSRSRASRSRAGSSRTAQEHAGTVDTPLTQRSGFLFAARSPATPFA